MQRSLELSNDQIRIIIVALRNYSGTLRSILTVFVLSWNLMFKSIVIEYKDV